VKPLPAPAEAREVLRSLGADAEEVAQLERYAGWLAGAGVERGLIGPREAERLWPRHLINSAVTLPLLPSTGSVCDLGSGAGLPGLVVRILRPQLSMVLLEPLLRRSQFLVEVVGDLGLTGTIVVRARAADYAARRPAHDVVVARAVAPLAQLADWALPLLRPGGELLAMKGERAASELADAEPDLDRLGVVEREILTLGEGGNVTHAVRVVRPVTPRSTASAQ
jgi:16S rRNA (guanine527-N7)-methyltransferase